MPRVHGPGSSRPQRENETQVDPDELDFEIEVEDELNELDED